MTTAGSRQRISIAVRIFLPFNNSLGENPLAFGVLLYIIKNSCKAVSGGFVDFLILCFNV